MNTIRYPLLVVLLLAVGCQSPLDGPDSSAAAPAAGPGETALDPGSPIGVRSGETLSGLPVLGLNTPGEAATLAQMRSMCAAYRNVTVEFQGDRQPVRLRSNGPAGAASSGALEALQRWQPYLDAATVELIRQQTGGIGPAMVQGDIQVMLRSQRDDWMRRANQSPGAYGMPNRQWGSYLVVWFNRVDEVRRLEP